LKKNPESNLGWRIILGIKKRGLAISCVREAGNKTHLHQLIPGDFKKSILEEVEKFVPPTNDDLAEAGDKQSEGLTIKLTSFEGAKGLSAQHVFLVGLQAGDLPRDEKNVQDLEICKFLVGLTRTKKRCAIMLTKRFGSDWKKPSIFLRWISEKRYERLLIDARSWGSSASLFSPRHLLDIYRCGRVERQKRELRSRASDITSLRTCRQPFERAFVLSADSGLRTG